MKTADVKWRLAIILVGIMILSTCSVYARVSGIGFEETKDAMAGTIGMLNPYLNGQELIVYKNESDSGHRQPQIIYGTFMVNGQQVTRSLYCIDFAKSLQSGTRFSEQSDYQRLNQNQKRAIAYVLGKTQILDAPRNPEGGFDNTGNLTAWREYMGTQLLIWYYINQYYTPGSCEGIGWYGVERACADGYANLEYCTMVRRYVDGLNVIPSFSGQEATTAPLYKMTFSRSANGYETVLTDANGVLERFTFQNIDEAVYTSSGNTMSIRLSASVAERQELTLRGAFTPQVGNITYVTGADSDVQPLLRCDGILSGNPVMAYLKLYTEPMGGIRVYKQAVSAMTSMYSMQGAVYGVFKNETDAERNQRPLAAIRINQKDASGADYGEVNGLPYGTYYVRETEGPQDAAGQAVGYWALDKTIHTVVVKDGYDSSIQVGQPAIVTSREQNYTASIRINKESAEPEIENDTTTMTGAVYGVYRSRSVAEHAGTEYKDSAAAQQGARNEGAEAVIVIRKNADGIYGEVSGLPLGIYYIKEVYAPAGWIVEDTVHKADVSKCNEKTFITELTVVSKEMPEYGLIFVGKSRKENRFDVINQSFDISKAGNMEGAEYGVFTTYADAQQAQKKGSNDTTAYTDGRVTTIVTNQSGTAILGGPDLSGYAVYGISKALPKGTYYVVETKAPAGWMLDEKIYQKTTARKLKGEAGVYYALISSQEVEHSGSVELYKTDITGEVRIADATLEGAKYGIYIERLTGDSGLKKVEGVEIVTDETGYGYIEGIPEGFYYIKEEVAPPGYQLDTNVYPLEITSELLTREKPVIRLESKETPIRTDYIIQKYTVEDKQGATEPTPLSGCTFGLYLESELNMNELTRDAAGKPVLEFAYDEAGCVVTKGTILEGKEPYYTAETDKDGRAVFHNCYPGTYIVLEMKIGSRKDGSTYRAVEAYEVTLPVSDGQGGYKEEVTAELVDDFAGEYLKIWKLDKQTGETVTGRTAFRIYDYQQEAYIKVSVNGELSDTIETDGNGYIELDNRLGVGHYRLEEVEAPLRYELKNVELRVWDGYAEYRESGSDRNDTGEWFRTETEEKNGMTFQIVRVEDNPYQIQVEKLDEKGEYVTGATLAIVHADGDRPASNSAGNYEILQIANPKNSNMSSGEEGAFEMIDAKWKTDEGIRTWEYIPRGEYFLVELQAPDGYEVAEPIPFTVGDEIKTVVTNGVEKQINEKNQMVSMIDRRLVGRVAVVKTGAALTGIDCEKTEYGELYHLQYEQKPMAGVTFKIYNRETDEEVCSFTTKKDGITYSPELNLEEGQSYYMMETAAPAGMVMSRERYPCEILYDNSASEYITEVITVENQPAEAELRIYKQGDVMDNITDGRAYFEKAGIPDTYFGIYSGEELLDDEGNVLVQEDALLGIGITNADGCAVINEKLPAGSYYWKELKPAEGYILDEGKYPFEIIYQPDSKEAVTIFALNEQEPLYNRLYKAQVILNKKGTNDIRLPGVAFALYQGKKKLGDYVTDEKGQVSVSELPYGEYYFKEVKGLAGYLFDTEKHYEFKVAAEENQIIELTVINEESDEKTIPLTGDFVPALWGIVLLVISLAGFGITNIIAFFRGGWSRKNRQSVRGGMNDET